MTMQKILIALFLLLPSMAFAQQAKVVATCGTVPLPLAVGSTQYITIDVNGNSCISGSSTPDVVQGNQSNASSGVAATSTNVPSVSYNYLWNGTTWDQAP